MIFVPIHPENGDEQKQDLHTPLGTRSLSARHLEGPGNSHVLPVAATQSTRLNASVRRKKDPFGFTLLS